MIFKTKNQKLAKARKELFSDTRVVVLTLRLLQQTLDNYIEGWLDGELSAYLAQHSLPVEKSDSLILLMQACHFIVAQTLYDSDLPPKN